MLVLNAMSDSRWRPFTTDPDAAESSILIVTVTGDPEVVTTELERVPRPVSK
jgi:hypothetical protein